MPMAMTIHDIQVRDRPGSPVSADLLRKYLAMLDGFTIQGTLTPAGSIVDVRADAKRLPANVADSLQTMSESFEQLALPLPDEPVGIGARWDSTDTLELGGLKVKMTTHVAITKLDRDQVGFHTTKELTAPKQTIQQPGVEVSVDRGSGSGTGDGTVDLAGFTISGQSTTSFSAELSAGSDHAVAAQKVEVTMSPVTP
jgi:hypothetical protein